MIQLNEYLINKTTKEKGNFTFDEFVDEIDKHWQGRLYIKKTQMGGGNTGFNEYTKVILTTTEHYSSKMSVYIPLFYYQEDKEILIQEYLSNSIPQDHFYIMVRDQKIDIVGNNIDYDICSFEDSEKYKIVLFPMNIKTLDYIYNILKKYDA